MAKLFKNISLEERYKQSSLEIRLPKNNEKVEAALLKAAPKAKEMNSALLKAMLPKAEHSSIPNPIPFTTTPLSGLNVPFVNSKFRSSINLSNRIKQPALGSTTHLPQYFLSDQFTDYITIKPLGPGKDQGGLLPKKLVFDFQKSQGFIRTGQGIESPVTVQAFTIFNHQSTTTVKQITFDSLLLQGTFFSNGAYISRTQTTVSISRQQISQRQGLGTDPTSTATTTKIQRLQGPGTDPTKSKPIASLALLQGLIYNNAFFSRIQPTTPPAEGRLTTNPQIVVEKPIEETAKRVPDYVKVVATGDVIPQIPQVPATIKIVNTAGTPDQGVDSKLGKTRQIVFEPNRTTPILKVLAYQLDKLTARSAPIVKHGATNLPAWSLFSNIYTSPQTKGRLQLISSLLNTGKGPNTSSAPPDNITKLSDYLAAIKKPDANPQPIDNANYKLVGEKETDPKTKATVYSNIQNAPVSENSTEAVRTKKNQITKLMGGELGASNTELEKIVEESVDGTNRLNPVSDINNNTVDAVSLPGSKKAGSLNDYATFKYQQIKQRQKNPTGYSDGLGNTNKGGDFRKIIVDENKANLDNGNTQFTKSVKPLDYNAGESTAGDYAEKLGQEVANRLTTGKNLISIDDLASQNDSTGNKRSLSKFGNQDAIDGNTGKKLEKQFPKTYGDIANAAKTIGPVTPIGMDPARANALENNLKIVISGPNGSVSFPAYLTALTDGMTPTWNDLQYVGRQETFKTFKGVTRAGSVGFKVISFSPTEAARNKQKLNSLMNITSVGSAGSPYVIAPLCTLTVGKWFINKTVAFNSCKIDVELADATWDIDQGLPHIINVSLDFAVLQQLPAGSYIG